MKFKVRTNNERKIDLNWVAVNAYLSRWKPNTELEVEIRRRQKKVSPPMRRYYFGVILPPYMEHLGYEPQETDLFHKQLKITYFQIKPDKKGIYRDKDIPSVFGDDSEIPVPIKKKFLDWVVRCAARDGLYIDMERDQSRTMV